MNLSRYPLRRSESSAAFCRSLIDAPGRMGGENVLLRLVHRAIHFGLLFGELAAHRVRARHIGRIPAVLGAGIDHDQVAGTQHARVLAPMKDRSVLAAPQWCRRPGPWRPPRKTRTPSASARRARSLPVPWRAPPPRDLPA